jgi:calcineurin-like phosphoesterase family protein
MNVFYTSDLHLGHERIIELCNRPFDSVDEMNEETIDRWNEVVNPNDWVWVLGDVALGKIAESLPLVLRMNGYKTLIPGNHDRCWSGNRKIRPVDRARYLDVGLRIIGENIYSDSKNWRLCHFPYEGDSQDEDRYEKHRPIRGEEDWLIHGHVHNSWKMKDNQINVGVDVWNFYPVSEEELRILMKKTP